MAEGAGPAISVVVCSYNGADTIATCLKALERQTIREQVQVIVVDDGSIDDTAEVARRFDVELVEFPTNRGISQARNSGITAARAPIIAFTDDDCVPDESWCERLLAGYDRPEVLGVGGAVEVYRIRGVVDRYLVDNNPLVPLELELDEKRSLSSRLLLYVRRMWQPPRTGLAREVFSFPGANMSFRRSVLDAIGAFDERMTFGADDEYICTQVRAHDAGGVLWFEPKAIIRHDFVGTLRDVVRRNFAYGRGHARSYLLEADHGWPIIFPVPGLTMLTLVLLRRRPLLLALVPAAVLLALPQGVVSARRHRQSSNLVFSYLRLVEETAHNVGMLSGLIDVRNGWASRRS